MRISTLVLLATLHFFIQPSPILADVSDYYVKWMPVKYALREPATVFMRIDLVTNFDGPDQTEETRVVTNQELSLLPVTGEQARYAVNDIVHMGEQLYRGTDQVLVSDVQPSKYSTGFVDGARLRDLLRVYGNRGQAFLMFSIWHRAGIYTKPVVAALVPVDNSLLTAEAPKKLQLSDGKGNEFALSISRIGSEHAIITKSAVQPKIEALRQLSLGKEAEQILDSIVELVLP